MTLSSNGTVAARLSSDAASHLRTFVGQDVYDLSLSFAQWKRARSAPSVLRDSDYPYYGRIDWFPAEELFDGDHPSRPRERWLELVDDWLPHVRDSIIKMRDDPVAAEERRVQPSSMVFETDEYSHWAKFIDENQRTPQAQVAFGVRVT